MGSEEGAVFALEKDLASPQSYDIPLGQVISLSLSLFICNM